MYMCVRVVSGHVYVCKYYLFCLKMFLRFPVGFGTALMA
jgi:hypothetical protein